MSDLISKSETIDLLYQVFEKHSMATDKNVPLCGFGAELFKNIKAMPTAFDTDKVIEQLGKRSMLSTPMGMVPFKEAVEIIKRGGKE